MVLAGIAILLALFTAFFQTGDAARQQGDRAGASVFPRFERKIAQAHIIRVTSADVQYTLKRASEDSADWVMLESGLYPVRPDRLAELATGLRDLVWSDQRTSDPQKLDRISLGHPETGGAGALIDVLDDEGRSLASLIIGRRADKLYGRFPDENKSYRLSGNVPPLYTREAWLDLAIIDTQPDAVGAVRITQANGRTMFVTRPPGSGPRAFRPAPPFERDTLVSRLAVSGPALAISRFAPLDVKPAAALQTRPVGRHITTTHDGLEIDVSAYREPDGFFVTLRAIEAGEGAVRAQSINDRANGWAYRLSEFDWNDFTPRVFSLVRRPAPVEEDTPPARPSGPQPFSIPNPENIPPIDLDP
jgi:hypothetical protein